MYGLLVCFNAGNGWVAGGCWDDEIDSFFCLIYGKIIELMVLIVCNYHFIVLC